MINEIEGNQGRKVAQARVIAIDPRLGYESPIKAIGKDRFRETAAAKALLEQGTMVKELDLHNDGPRHHGGPVTMYRFFFVAEECPHRT